MGLAVSIQKFLLEESWQREMVRLFYITTAGSTLSQHVLLNNNTSELILLRTN
jgi:hypothetical protein